MQKFIFIFSLLAINNLHAQWSVKEGDTRPAKDKNDWYLYQPFTKEQWNAGNFAGTADMQWHEKARYGMFIHFGLSAHEDKDLSWPIVYNRKAPDGGHGDYPDSAWQKTWPSEFKLEKFNADEWVNIAKEAGMKYIIVIAKHHDGFHMWDTKYSSFKITNTPFGRDYLKEIADACHKAGMRFGIYYSQRDWYHPDYAPVDTNTIERIDDPPYYKAMAGKKVEQGATHKKYIDYQFNVIKELLTNYGTVDEFWFDAVWWGGMFTADMWDAEKLTRMMRQLQPHIIINNRASLPGDFDTPEQRIGMYQQRPWESAMTLNGSWAYSPEPVKPVKNLITEMLMAAAGNGNELLSWGAHWNGAFDAAQKDTLLKIGRWLKQYGNAYYGTHGGPWMPGRNIGSVYKGNKIYLYVFNWNDEAFTLPALHGNTILNASFINIPGKVVWRDSADNILFIRPASTDSIVNIIELTMAKTVAGIVTKNNYSLFDDPVYGEKIFHRSINPTDWRQHNYIVNLEKNTLVTGIGIYNKNSNSSINISVSADGKIWEHVASAKDKTKEISITTFTSGANVPGKAIQYIRFAVLNEGVGFTADVYSKQHPD